MIKTKVPKLRNNISTKTSRLTVLLITPISYSVKRKAIIYISSARITVSMLRLPYQSYVLCCATISVLSEMISVRVFFQLQGAAVLYNGIRFCSTAK